MNSSVDGSANSSDQAPPDAKPVISPDNGERPPAGELQYILTHPYSTATFITLFVMFIMATARHQSEWDQTYIGASRALLHGGDIYRDVKTNTYPPFSSWFFLPFAILPIHLARGIWFLINAVSFVILVKVSWRLAGGRHIEPSGDSSEKWFSIFGGMGGSPMSLQKRRSPDAATTGYEPPASRREQIAFLIGHACALQLALNGLTHLQTDLPIAALLMIGCAAIAAGRYLHAAAWIGVAAAFKATPLLFAPYLLLRGKWRAAILLVAIAVGANLLPNTVHAPHAGGTWLGEWYSQYVQPMTRPTYVPGDWKNMLNNNQALTGAASRWITSSWREDSEDLRTVDRPGYAPNWLRTQIRNAHPSFTDDEVNREATHKSVRAVLGFLYLLVILPASWAMWARWHYGIRWDAHGSAADRFPNIHMVECGIILALMLLLSPNSSRAHFCVLYLPAFCIARLAVRPGASMILRILLGLAVLSATLSMHIRLPFTMTVEQIFLWLGVAMFAAIFLLLASVAAMVSEQRTRTIS